MASIAGALGRGVGSGDVAVGVVRVTLGTGDMLLWNVWSLVRGVGEGSVLVGLVVCVWSGCAGAGAVS